VLIGGRPVPPWIRLLIILALLPQIVPAAKNAVAYLPAYGIGRPAKMTAEGAAAALPARLYWARPDAHSDIRCQAHRETSDWKPERAGAWDYICTFGPRPGTNPERVKVGVRVRGDAIVDVSSPYSLDAPYVR
jgi:hypothetical protein